MGNIPGQLRLDLGDNDGRRKRGHSRQGHGSRACYIAGCRQAVCVEANARYQRDYRNGQRGTHDNRQGPYRIEAGQ